MRRLLIATVFLITSNAWARDLEYKNQEIAINVTPQEPTSISFPEEVQGGFIKTGSALHLDRRGSDLVVFATEELNEAGEVLVVRLGDGRNYSIRVRRADKDHPRDDVIRIQDSRPAFAAEEEELAAYKDKKFDYAPPSTVSGLVREMVLVSEFGKKNIAGYRVSEKYRGETVLSDGAVHAVIEKIFIGPNLWGYVLSAHNQLDQTQQINPATFRLDGTRAVSSTRWELAPRPLNIEQQISGKDKTKVYIVTRPKKFR